MLLKNVIASFCDAVFTPKKAGAVGKETGDPRYSMVALIPPDHPQLNEVWNLCEEQRMAKFPNGLPQKADYCLQEYDVKFANKEYYDSRFSGWWALTCNSKQTSKPQIGCFDQQGGIEQCIDPAAIWPGQVVHVSVGFFAYDTGTGGVAAGLNGVLLTGEDGPMGRIDGRQNLGDMFNELAGTGAAKGPGANRPTGPGAAPGNRPAGPGANRPAGPGAAPGTRPAGPGAPQRSAPKPPSAPAKVMTANAEYTYEEYIKEGWTDADLIEQGLMVGPRVQPV